MAAGRERTGSDELRVERLAGIAVGERSSGQAGNAEKSGEVGIAGRSEKSGKLGKPGKPGKSASQPFPFARMLTNPYALDRLDIRFRWGDYGVRVLRCHLAAFSPGHVIPSHKHSEFEFHFIAKGKGNVTMGGQTYELLEGQFYVTGPDVIHAQESDPDDPMHELCLHIEFIPLPSRQDDPEADWGRPLECREAASCIGMLRQFPLTTVWDTYHAMGAFLDAYRTWEEEPPGYHTQLRQAIIQILLRSTRVFADPVAVIPERDMNGHRYELATQYIRDNESRPITLSEVAERVNVSSRQLQRIFQSEGGIPFRDYVEHVRLSAVCADLLHTNRSIEEIALLHGYATPTYLFPVFKHKFGVTPAVYRRMNVGSGVVSDTF